MKVKAGEFKASINKSKFTKGQITIIWDFYVTKAIAGSASQQRKITEYNRNKIPFNEMMQIADVDDENIKCLLADKMPNTLKNMGLEINKGEIDVQVPRIACLIPYQISDEGEPMPKSGNNRYNCLFAHIRNALAHGNTYFFDNGNMLFEDKNNSTTTAMILIKQKTLLDWIKLIDEEERFYSIKET